MKNLKKKLIILGLSLSIIGYTSIDYFYTPKIEISEDGDSFARYSLGKVYIGDHKYLKSLDNIEEFDILVEDLRGEKDPNMKVYNSIKINDRELVNEIIEILLEYERQNPSKWNRTAESMRVEWIMHNLSYLFNIERNRTLDVDFNNGDQEKYDKIVVRKLLKL